MSRNEMYDKAIFQARHTAYLEALGSAQRATHAGAIQDLSSGQTEAGQADAPSGHSPQVESDTASAVDVASSQADACRETLGSLEAFFTQTWKLFWTGFFPASNSYSFEPSLDYPWRYVLRTLLEESSIDLAAVQQAIHNRRLAPQSDVVFVGDVVAQAALTPAVVANLIQPATAICYLGSRYNVRLLPYAPVLLIGVPYATSADPQLGRLAAGTTGDTADTSTRLPNGDYLAIPHEVGHHIYWHGRTTDDIPIRKALAKRLDIEGLPEEDWRWRWLEEIFADAYSCLVAGPLTVLTFQDMLLANPQHHKHDHGAGKHPFPELRPFIQTQILSRIKKSTGRGSLYRRAQAVLDDYWCDRLGHDPRKECFVLGQYTALTGHDIIEGLDNVIDQMLAIMDALRRQDPDFAWTEDVQSKNTLHKLNAQFVERYRSWEQACIESARPYQTHARGAALLPESELPQDLLVLYGQIQAQTGPIAAADWAGDDKVYPISGWSTEGGTGSKH